VSFRRFVLFLPVLWILAACAEDLTGGNTCPALCPVENIPLEEVVIEPVAFAASVGDFPLRGTENGLWLATRGDSLDVRVIVRYDTVTSTYLSQGTARPITSVDSAHVMVRFALANANWTDDITLEAYDVDAPGNDTATAAVAALFTPDRLLGSAVANRTALLLDDSVKVYLRNDVILNKVRTGARIRIGLRLAGTGTALLQSVETGAPPRLSFQPDRSDPDARQLNIAPVSRTPVGNPALAFELTDHSIFVRGTETSDATRLIVGGIPARRTYLRLVVPTFYLDSVVLVRAQLSLYQRSSGGVDRTEPLAISPVAVSATSRIVDISRAASLVFPALQFGIGAIVAAPADSGERRIDLIQLVRQWTAVSARENGPQTALVLQSLNEATAAGYLEFWGPDAPPALRPKLRLSYIPRARFGRP
jgi:hypothetical protein